MKLVNVQLCEILSCFCDYEFLHHFSMIKKGKRPSLRDFVIRRKYVIARMHLMIFNVMRYAYEYIFFTVSVIRISFHSIKINKHSNDWQSARNSLNVMHINIGKHTILMHLYIIYGLSVRQLLSVSYA